MPKWRIWAESISDVYLDVEADTFEHALEVAYDADGAEFHDTCGGDWKISNTEYKLDDNVTVDCSYDDFINN